jgi:flagellar assembly factor FliW
MKFVSSRLGEITFDEDKVITFPEGIPGFNDFKKYIILQKEDNNIFFIMHSIENKDLAFIITSPFLFKLDYMFQLSADDYKFLNITKIDEIAIFAITKIDKEKNIFINLKAPLCINFQSKRGKQVILYDKDYPAAYKIEKRNYENKSDKIIPNNFKVMMNKMG